MNVDRRERHYYNHDIGALPPLVKKVIGNTDPAAVVKIRKEKDAVELLKFANRHKIPVVPQSRSLFRVWRSNSYKRRNSCRCNSTE